MSAAGLASSLSPRWLSLSFAPLNLYYASPIPVLYASLAYSQANPSGQVSGSSFQASHSIF